MGVYGYKNMLRHEDIRLIYEITSIGTIHVPTQVSREAVNILYSQQYSCVRTTVVYYVQQLQHYVHKIYELFRHHSMLFYCHQFKSVNF